MQKRERLERKINTAVQNMTTYLAEQGIKPTSMYHYGAIDIDPKYLTLHIMLETTAKTEKAEENPELIDRCYAILKEAKYPKGEKQGVHIRFQSIQKINEEAGGNWYHYFK